MHGWRRFVFLAVLAGAGAFAARLHASSALLLWPLDPVIEASDPGAALWVENRGQRAATMQLRVLAWTQEDGEHRHVPQTEIVGTPAIFRVEPGKRQFVRLTRTQPPAAGAEQAYRVLIDEIPDARQRQVAASNAGAPIASGLRFQLRYSIPLFSYGAGLASLKQPEAGAPQVQWRQAGEWIEVRNTGRLHAKLVDLAARDGAGRDIAIADGHLGYVLAGSTGRWKLRDEGARAASVQAGVNGSAPRPIEPGTP